MTIAIELDENPEDVSFVFEPDPGLAAKTASAGRTAHIDGVSHVPFDTFDAMGTIVRNIQVTPDEQYRLTLLDRGSDGLQSPSAGGRQARFRMCYGNVTGPDCISASLDSDLVICSGNGNFNIAKSITCFVNQLETPAPTPQPTDPPIIDPLSNPLSATMPKPPTFAPFEVPLLFYGDDDRLRPTPKPTGNPTQEPTTEEPTGVPTTMAPSTESPTIDGTSSPTKAVPTAFLSGTSYQTFVIKSTKAPTVDTNVFKSSDDETYSDEISSDETIGVSNDVVVIAPKTSAVLDTSSSVRRVCVTSVKVAMAISAVYFAVG